MSVTRRMKASVTGQKLAAAATLNIPDGASILHMTGTATVTKINVNREDWGHRVLTFQQFDSGATTFTDTASATTAGQMDLGGSPTNIAIGQADILKLLVGLDGVLRRVAAQANN